MDIKTQSALGVHCLNVLTAVTAQNNDNVVAINPTEDNQILQQIRSSEAFEVNAIKSGLITTIEQVSAIIKTIERLNCPYVCDPVLAATSGKHFSNAELLEALRFFLFPHCTLITPNLIEAEILTGMKIHTSEDIEKAAQKLNHVGAKAVYIKGGHFEHSGDYVCDYFYSREHAFWLSSPKVETVNLRGTGCAFASAVAAALAQGYPVSDAVIIAKMAINQGIRQSYGLAGKDKSQKGPIYITHFPKEQEDLPLLTQHLQQDLSPSSFPGCDETPLGLYPVVDSAAWLERLLPLGVTTAQLRVKNLSGDALEAEIKSAIEIGKKHNCRLFINDYWPEAIKHGAYGVHLGQEDLDTADIRAIREAGLRLGTSTHCHYEVARAHALRPSYIACGPVYETTTKDMPWIPHGLKGLKYWAETLNYPLVAIGGINRERIPKVTEMGPSGVAMITAITLAGDPEKTTLDFMQMVQAGQS